MTQNRDFLMLAHTFDAAKHGVGGWFMSEKIDGQRAFWDGGISRGILKGNIPWANHDKDDRYVRAQRATGLWSRLGNVIHAPDWWLNELPPMMMDGELWHGKRGHGERQNLSRVIKKIDPTGDGWKGVKYFVFDLPAPNAVFRDGRVNNTHFKKIFKGFKTWHAEAKLEYRPIELVRFERSVREMERREGNKVVVYHNQIRLPFQTAKALAIIEDRLHYICDIGGEGLMLRKPESMWEPKRLSTILKVKKLDDDEGIVTGYVTGRETDKGSKLLGLMGALILNYQGKRLELSGFTDAERRLQNIKPMISGGAREWAENNPGQEVPDWISSEYFPRGCSVTFRYRGTSLDGIPTEARYWRKDDR